MTQVGLEAVAGAFAYGASAVRMLIRAKPRHDVAGLYQTIALAEPILAGLGFAGSRVATIETDDPDKLGATLRAIAAMDGAAKPATFTAVGRKREVVRLALRELHGVAPAPTDIIALPAGSPFGTLDVKVEGCTLCLACVPACPTGALSDDPEKPMLRFAEDACVQCGLCQATCPEKVISLKPQIDFRSATADKRVIKQEEPYVCIRCGKPFGVKSSVERVIASLEGKHWMFKDSKKRLDVIRMCSRLPRGRHGRGEFRSVRRPRPPDRAHHRGLSARAGSRRAEGRELGARSSGPRIDAARSMGPGDGQFRPRLLADPRADSGDAAQDSGGGRRGGSGICRPGRACHPGRIPGRCRHEAVAQSQRISTPVAAPPLEMRNASPARSCDGDTV